MPHTSANSHLHARVSKDAGGPARAAASCFETHRSGAAFAEAYVLASAAMLLSTRPGESTALTPPSS
jgi:hypothetical protein